MLKGKELTREMDQRLAAPMFVLSLVVLGLFATLIYLTDLEAGGYIVYACLFGLAILYPVFWLETAAHIYARSPLMKQHIWFCLIPITRLGGRDHETGRRVWLPRWNWQEANRPLERKLARHFSIPMIVIALMVLPIIVMEFFYKDFVDANYGWTLAMKIAEAFIWSAFTFEFILMLWVVKYPMGYVRKHWIDLAIILLPTLAFMRTMRLASIGRLNQLTRTARIYRLRGLGMRMWRGFVALEVIEMLLSRNPERRLEKLESQLEDKQEEIDLLQKDIRQLKSRIQQKRQEEEEEEEGKPRAVSEDSDDGDSTDDGDPKKPNGDSNQSTVDLKSA